MFIAILLSIVTLGSNLYGMPGYGFDTFNERLSFKPCLSYDLEWTGSFQTIAKLHKPIPRFEMESFVGRSLSSFSGIDSKSSAVLLKQLVGNHPTRHFQAYGFKVSGLKAQATNPQLTGDVWRSGDPSLIQARCGDRFVQSATYGGVLVVGFYFDFASRNQKNAFLNKYDLNHIGIETLFLTIDSESMSDLVRQLGVVAFQWGGDTSKLYNLTAGSEYRCRRDKLASCQKLAAELVDYVAGDGGFRDQINSIGPESALQTRALSADFEPYTVVDANVEQWNWPETAVSAKRQVIDLVGEIAESRRLVSTQLGGPMMQEDRDRIRGISHSLSRTASQVSEVVKRCQIHPESCAAGYSGLPDVVRNIDPNQYAGIVRADVESVCRFPGRYGSISADLAKIWAKYGLDPAECSYNFAYLKQVRTMDLSGLKLKRIDFLASLPRLERLDLSDNQIADGGPLLWLDSIRYLDVSRNRIKDTAELRQKFEREGIVFKYSGNPE